MPRLLLPLAALALAAAGCATTVRIEVQSNEKTNGGRPLYMMVRTVDSRALLSEDYAQASALVFTHPPDKSVQKVQTLLPGKPVTLNVPRPEESELALYFFFTQPGDKWRVPLNQPIPSDVVVELGGSNVKRVMVRKK
jgi:ABC-type Fe3+-hydroxamate transport system substrate-binding protein